MVQLIPKLKGFQVRAKGDEQLLQHDLPHCGVLYFRAQREQDFFQFRDIRRLCFLQQGQMLENSPRLVRRGAGCVMGERGSRHGRLETPVKTREAREIWPGAPLAAHAFLLLYSTPIFPGFLRSPAVNRCSGI